MTVPHMTLDLMRSNDRPSVPVTLYTSNIIGQIINSTLAVDSVPDVRFTITYNYCVNDLFGRKVSAVGAV